ncbi:hypothetical protein SETIT_5G361400v2 [Setaria italica]|uniref:Uncharacterized protein n=1 Tax=Setaria italica TaxID=4555 RepID=A0A368RCQ3_SETIT|nr:hypothetical protein SETIT_5G361400v2 [Setaria italica]
MIIGFVFSWFFMARVSYYEVRALCCSLVGDSFSIEIYQFSSKNNFTLWLLGRLNNVVLEDQEDRFEWIWNKNGNFLVKSVYEHLAKYDRGEKSETELES